MLQTIYYKNINKLEVEELFILKDSSFQWAGTKRKVSKATPAAYKNQCAE